MRSFKTDFIQAAAHAREFAQWGVISVNYNDAGFLCADIEEQKCVRCGKCLAVCPGNESNQVIDGEMEPEAIWRGRQILETACEKEVKEVMCF